MLRQAVIEERLRKARALRRQGKPAQDGSLYRQVLAKYERTLALNPDDAQTLYNRGNALRAIKRHVEAIQSYDSALVVKPDYVEALSNRGNALRDLKRHQDALASYERALALKPATPEHSTTAARRCAR